MSFRHTKQRYFGVETSKNGEKKYLCGVLSIKSDIYTMLSKLKLNQLYLRDTQFANLMTRRIFNVLLIANPYDAFMLEDDGRIDEKIFNEYASLSLRYPPRFTQVSSCDEAIAQLESMSYDLIICMPGTGDNEGFDVARRIKNAYEHIPMVILTPFSHGITQRIVGEDLSSFE